MPHEYWVRSTCADNASGGPEYYDLDFVYLTGEIVAREQDGYGAGSLSAVSVNNRRTWVSA